MKYVMIIIDGLGDEPIKELNYKTPLEKAFIPNIQYIATRGQIGTIETTFEGFPVESMVCIMGLLGYDPKKYYPYGRASFEAMAKGINLKENDLAFRCNIVTTDDNQKFIKDFTSNLISDTEAKKFISKIKLPFNNWELHAGQSYRNILIIRDCNVNVKDINCYPPHMHIGEEINSLKINFKNKNGDKLSEELWDFLMNSYNRENNRMLWLWSPSTSIDWPSFYSITGLKGSVVCGMDFLRGIAMAADMDFDVIPGTTGYIDTDYKTKGKYAINYLKNHDFVLVHINATDEEAHQHNYNGKIKAIEKIDNLIVGPILQELHEKYNDKFRIVVCGDHMTRCRDGKHIAKPVPFTICGEKIRCENSLEFTEKNCEKNKLLKSLEFIKGKMIDNL